MRTQHRYSRLTLFGLLVLGLPFIGCVDEQENLPEATLAGVRIHPDGWKTADSPSFHGKIIRADGWDLASCQTCHGKKYDGGTAKISCASAGCHNTAGPEDCTTCHGDPLVNAAPPEDLDGNTQSNVRGVGAHQAHLVAGLGSSGTSGKLVNCQECHVVPDALTAIGHIDTTTVDRAEVIMSQPLANTSTDNGSVDPNPTYNAATFECSSTYCHGTFKNGNTTNAVLWTNPATAACGTCHGDKNLSTTKEKALPKTAAQGGTHPVNTNCSECHTNIDANAAFTDVQAHIDGSVTLGDLSTKCSGCHGSTVNAAPPADVAGNTAVTSKGVGAHQAHLVGSGKALEVSCAECHTVPSTVDLTGADGHIDATSGAEVPLAGPLANLVTSGGTPDPVYTSGTATCSGTYCHGTFTNGNQTNAPLWNGAAGTGAQCGTCHGDVTKTTIAQKARPGGSHPTWTNCQWCHSNVNSTPAITDGSTHVNGTVNLVTFNLPADCSKCHGTGSDPAPPADLDGNIAVTSKGVGAHQAHLAATGAKAVACAECHTVPTSVYQTGHLDSDRPAEVPLAGALANLATSGVDPDPVYTSSSATCGNTYCHGTFKNGNQPTAPVWNSAAGTGAPCGSCHGDVTKATPAEKALPKGTHLPYTECQWCHTSVTQGPSFADPNDHVDGTAPLFQWSSPTDCSRCHGSINNAAPPKDLAGETNSAKVGAHQAHLGGLTAAPVACSECHTVPTGLDYNGSDGHLDGTAGAEVAFADTLANETTTGGPVVSPAYSSAQMSCGSTYCHGTFRNGNSSNTPVWDNPSTAACGTCHGNSGTGNPLPGGSHLQGAGFNACEACHKDKNGTTVATYNSSSGTWSITTPSLHVNGFLNVYTSDRYPWYTP